MAKDLPPSTSNHNADHEHSSDDAVSILGLKRAIREASRNGVSIRVISWPSGSAYWTLHGSTGVELLTSGSYMDLGAAIRAASQLKTDNYPEATILVEGQPLSSLD